MLKEGHSLSPVQEFTGASLSIEQSPGLLQRIFPWAAKGGFAILDQVLFAGANFAVNILLARWLPPAEYGAFALAYSIFLLLGTFHTAIFTEPMLVFGPGKYRECFREYLGILLRGHFRLMIPGGLILVGAAFLFGRVYSASLEPALLGLAFAAPLILLLWLARKALYAQLRPGCAAAGGCLYLVLLLGSMAILRVEDWLSLGTAFIAIGIAASVASVFFMIILGPHWKTRGSNPSAQIVFSDHRRYGRWSAATAGIIWFPGNIYFILLPIWIGLEGAGALKALINLAMPVLQIISALSLILLPILVQDLKLRGARVMGKTMRSFFLLFLFGSMLYLAILWGLRDEIFRLLYAGKYMEYASWPVLLAGALPLGTCVTAALSNTLRALERPDLIFWCYLGSSIVALLAGIPLIADIGVAGALLGQLFSSLAAGALMYWFYRKFQREKVAVAA